MLECIDSDVSGMSRWKRALQDVKCERTGTSS